MVQSIRFYLLEKGVKHMNLRKQAVWLILAGMTYNLLLHPANLALAETSRIPAQASQLVSINQASAEELESVKGVGPALAERIIDYRAANGKFKSLDQLKEVRGIGEAKLSKMKEQITL